MDIQAQVDAMVRELSAQRTILGDRAMQLAAQNAQFVEDIKALQKRIEELTPKTEAPQ